MGYFFLCKKENNIFSPGNFLYPSKAAIIVSFKDKNLSMLSEYVFKIYTIMSTGKSLNKHFSAKDELSSYRDEVTFLPLLYLIFRLLCYGEKHDD